MTRVLFVGQLPETVDYSDPALPPGLNVRRFRPASMSRQPRSRSGAGLEISATFRQTTRESPRSKSNWRAQPTNAWSLAASCGYRPRGC